MKKTMTKTEMKAIAGRSGKRGNARIRGLLACESGLRATPARIASHANPWIDILSIDILSLGFSRERDIGFSEVFGIVSISRLGGSDLH